MFKHLVTAVLAVVSGLLLSSNAGAQCPSWAANGILASWALEEIYSNADGSVQFLVMVSAAVAGVSAPPLAGTTLIASDGATENAYTFPSDLPSRKNGQRFLVGTQGFADLNLVKPDFVMPNGFMFVRNGSVRLAGTPWCAGPIQYDALPADGVNAYFPDAFGDGGVYIAAATALNFAGKSFGFTRNHGGLWWNSPAGSESGWGIVVEHQRDIVFAAWATYDTDGSPVWFVMPRADLSPADDIEPNTTWQGPIYRVTGHAFSAVPFDPAAVTATHVGSGGFHFPRSTDNGIGTFYYEINGTSAYKSITRQVFADPVSVCVEGGTPGPTPNFQGMWWNASEAGWGLHLSHQGDIIFAVWLTYDTAGKATWLAMTASKTAPNNYAGTIYRTKGPAFSAAFFDPSAVTGTQVGTGTLTFGDRDSGAFAFVCGGCGVDGVAQTKRITRQIFAAPPAVCN
jgi:hypothetical protein